MAKKLTDIVKSKDKRLESVKASKVSPGSTGERPGVDYKPKAPSEQEFVDLHNIEKHAGRAGNSIGVYDGGPVKYSMDDSRMKNFGHKKGKDEEVNAVGESFNPLMQHDVDTLKGIHRRMSDALDRAHPNAKYSDISHTVDTEFQARKALAANGVKVARHKHKQVIESLSCNMSEDGKKCNVHGMDACPESTKKIKKLNEIITKKTSAGEIIKDFQQSDDPKFAGKSKEERQRMALGAYYGMHPEKSKTNEETELVNEDLAVPLLGGDSIAKFKTNDTESEIEMVKAELKAIANKAMHLVMAMPEGMHIEPWVQAKIAQAKETISGVHDHMIYGNHDKPEEDEQMDTPMTFPNMNVDVNAGVNV